MPAASGDKQIPRSEEVFISYSRKDKEFVRRLDEELKRREREAWVDWEGIPPGDTWEKTIYGAIESTHTFIFVLTPDSIASQVCGREVAHAAANNKRLVPIVHRDVAAERVPKSLGELNWIFCRDSDDFEAATDTLIRALDTDLKWVRAHTRLLTRAIEWDANGRNNSFVLRGEDLRAAEQWLAQAGAQKERQPTALQTEYIIASRKAETRRQRTIRTWVSVALVVAIVLAVVAFFAEGKAKKQTQVAVVATKRTSEVASRGNVSLAGYSELSGKNAQALAQLALALRLNPENRNASGFAASILTHLGWQVPLSGSMRHGADVTSAQFSPDGQRVVTASKDKTVRLWDAASGKPIAEPMKHDEEVNSAQFSPDGQRVVTASDDKTARLWDAASGKPIGEPMKHDDSVSSAQFSPNGQRVVTVARYTARLWDAATGKPIGEPMSHGDFVESAQFSPDGQRVVTASRDETARLWDAASGKPVGEFMKYHEEFSSAQFSPDGQRVVTVGRNTARLWDAASGKPIGEPMSHDDSVNSAQFSPDGQRVVTVGRNTARLWDAASGKPIGEPMKHDDSVNSAQFSPDGQRVVTASDDKTARLWDAATGKVIGQPLKHDDDVNSAQFSPDGQRVVTASDDKTARLWDAASGKPIGEPLRHDDKVNLTQFSPDGERVMTVSGRNTTRLWDVVSGKAVGEPMKHQGKVWSAQFSPDGQRVVTASEDTTARLWDAASGKPIGEPLKHDEELSSAQFSPDGQRVVTASSDDNTARLWDALSGKPIGEPIKHDSDVKSAQFSPDGQRVVTASRDKTARLWDAVSSKPIGEPMKHEDWVNSAQFSPDGQRVVTASRDNTARLWDAITGKPIGEPMSHADWVNSAQFSPDGQRVVTASRDKTARLWDAASSKPIGKPMIHYDEVNSAQFSPDGQRVVTASRDYTARLWDAATGKPIGEPMIHDNRVNWAQFSSDGQRVVTASEDTTARLWDAASGKSLGEPLKHEGRVLSAQFSPDGQRVVTASEDETARLWDAVISTDKDTTEDVLLLAELAEATGGVALETVGQAENLTVLTPDQSEATRQKIAAKYAGITSGLSPLQRLLKWSVSDRKNRTISPLSQETVSEWLENRIKEGTVEGLRSALQVDPANARVTAHLGRRLADHVLKQGGDPDEARRNRGESDFLTSRAHKLAPNNDEVKKLRDEVAKLLGGIVYEDFALGVDSDGPGGSVAQDPNWQSDTSLKYSNGRPIDSRKIPFIGLPAGIFAAGIVKLGDYAIAFNTFDGRQSFAVVGDDMPNRKKIYVSVALANLLSIQFDLEKQTVRGDKIIYLVFPASGSGHCPGSPAAIDEQGQKLFEAWGGISNMQVYLKSSEQ